MSITSCVFDACRSLKRMEFQVVVNSLMWVLGTKLGLFLTPASSQYHPVSHWDPFKIKDYKVTSHGEHQMVFFFFFEILGVNIVYLPQF